MYKYVFGIDPDSDKHGVAVYGHGDLIQLHSLTTPELMEMANRFDRATLLFSVEAPNSNKFIYARNRFDNPSIQGTVAMGIGKNQQSQVELCRWLDYLNIKYILNKPSKENWAKNKKQFERLTGWTGRSNEDTRSAAYFGFIALDVKTRIYKAKQAALAL